MLDAPLLADPKRLKQLQIRRILDTPREEAFDRLTRLAALCIHTPVTLLTFVDEHRQWFKSSYGLAEPWSSQRETPLTHSFCQHVVTAKKPFVVADARTHPLVQENLAIAEMSVASYLGAPLIDSDGSALGSFAVIDSTPRHWTMEHVKIVEDFAALAMLEVQLRTEVARRSETAEALRQAQKLEAVGRLAGGIAHDFNNILLVIQGYSTLLQEEMPADDSRSEYVLEIMKAAQRASALTLQLLAFSRKQVLKPQRINLNSIIKNLEPMLKRTLTAAIALSLELDEELGDVEADPGQMEQVIINLALNARDATLPRGQVSIKTCNKSADEINHSEIAEAQGHAWIELQVADSGCGMDSATLARIFEPFYTTKPVGKGTGLGLATVYGIVQQSGGRVRAESKPGAGSVFRVVLPRIETKPSVVAELNTPELPVSRGATLLVVEDDESVRKMLVLALQRAGHRVLEASTGKEALKCIDAFEDRIDLALLDIVMPGMNGRELGEALTKRLAGLKVLYMSGYTDDAPLLHGIKQDSVQFVQKPIVPTHLLAKITSILNDPTPH